MTIKHDQPQPTDGHAQQFVEEVGLAFERSGLTRMAGRMLGWLLVCDPPHQTQADLADALQASKGSVSGTVRLLVQLQLVERISRPGERRDYYRLRPDAWVQVMRYKMQETRAIRELTERGLTLLRDEPPERRARLQEMHDLYRFFERVLPRLMQEWEAERQLQA